MKTNVHQDKNNTQQDSLHVEVKQSPSYHKKLTFDSVREKKKKEKKRIKLIRSPNEEEMNSGNREELVSRLKIHIVEPSSSF